MNIEMPGLKALIARLKSAPVKLDVELVKALTRGAIVLQRAGRMEASVDTGRLRASIGFRVNPVALEATVYADATSDKGAPYPIYVHEGTGVYARDPSKTTGRIRNGGIHPNPFFDRAAAQTEGRVMAEFGEAAANLALYIGTFNG